jgi:ABC-type uncharacterized transport system permease subunit
MADLKLSGTPNAMRLESRFLAESTPEIVTVMCSTGKTSLQNLTYNFQINAKIYSGIGVTLIGYEPIVSGSLVYAPNKSFYNTITMGTGSMPFSTAMSLIKNKWTYTLKLAYLGNNLGFQPSFRLNYLINEQKSVTEPVGIDFVRQTVPSN